VWLQSGRFRRREQHGPHVRVRERETNLRLDIKPPVLDELKLERKGEPVAAPAAHVNALLDALGQLLIRHRAGRHAAELNASLKQEPAVAAQHRLLGIQAQELVVLVAIIVGHCDTS
jgi:hypothetical protein